MKRNETYTHQHRNSPEKRTTGVTRVLITDDGQMDRLPRSSSRDSMNESNRNHERKGSH